MKNKPFLIYFSAMAFGLIIVLALLAWRMVDSIEVYERHQISLAKGQAESTANAIKASLSILHKRMQAVVDDGFLDTDIDTLREDEEAQSVLQERLLRYFPEMYSYSLLTSSGNIIIGNLDFEMGEVCLQDVYEASQRLFLANNKQDYFPRIHPKFEAHHFDMILPVTKNAQNYLFFMNFHASFLVKLMVQQAVSDFPVYLVRQDLPDLIEVSYEGARDIIKREISLSQKEMQSILASKDIPNTLWRVVVVPKDADEFANYKQQRKIDFIVGSLLILGVWFVVLLGLVRYEQGREKWLDKLTFMSLHDSLTGAANRRQLEKTLQDWLDKYACEERHLGLIYLDLDNFKPVNDEYGHHFGDELLIETVKRLQKECPEDALVSRLGGDEFVVLIDLSVASEQDAYMNLALFSARCNQQIKQAFFIEGIEINISASIGSLLINPTFSFDEALKQADELMYRAKLSIKND